MTGQHHCWLADCLGAHRLLPSLVHCLIVVIVVIGGPGEWIWPLGRGTSPGRLRSDNVGVRGEYMFKPQLEILCGHRVELLDGVVLQRHLTQPDIYVDDGLTPSAYRVNTRGL